MSQEFLFCVIKVVPDPVKDEGVNVGVIVLSADGRNGDIMFNNRFKSRVTALRRDFPIESTLAGIEDLRAFVGLEGKRRLGGLASSGDGRQRLNAAIEYLEGQLQLTPAKAYQAEGLKSAVREIYQRYVAQKLPSPQVAASSQQTAADMRRRIWDTVRNWRDHNLVVEQGAVIRGRDARHSVDFVLKNGAPKAAIFVLPASNDDRHIGFLYRDSLPTIAIDVQAQYSGFHVLGVLPDVDETTPEGIRAFVEETRTFLAEYPQIRTVRLSGLSEMRGELTGALL